jgi:hypothetical protein
LLLQFLNHSKQKWWRAMPRGLAFAAARHLARPRGLHDRHLVPTRRYIRRSGEPEPPPLVSVTRPLSVFLSPHARAPWVQSLELATTVAPSSSSNNSRTTCSQYRAMPPPPKHAAASEAAMAARAQTVAACGQRATSHREPSRVLPRPRTSQELLCRCRCRSPPELR